MSPAAVAFSFLVFYHKKGKRRPRRGSPAQDYLERRERSCRLLAALGGPDAITVQQSELSEAAWIPRGEIALRAEDFSLTSELIDRFVRGEEPKE